MRQEHVLLVRRDLKIVLRLRGEVPLGLGEAEQPVVTRRETVDLDVAEDGRPFGAVADALQVPRRVDSGRASGEEAVPLVA